MNRYHHFLDEAGDTTFFGKGGIPMLGKEGVSKYCSMGICQFKEPLQPVRNKIISLEKRIATDPFFKVGSVHKKIAQTGRFYFHATDDMPEIRMMFLELIMSVNFEFEMAISEKNIEKFIKKHNRNERELYTDLLAHLLHSKMDKEGKHIFIVSQRGNTTRQATLKMALSKAVNILYTSNPGTTTNEEIVLDVVNQKSEPLLNFVDYLCWAVQRKLKEVKTAFMNL